MRTFAVALMVAVLVGGCGGPDRSGRAAPAAVTIFEGARIIVGDGSVIENGAFRIDGGVITRVGRAGEIVAPPGAARVDLTGRTVIPALIDAHAHLGYEGHTSWGGENYTRENVIDHLERYAHYGFGAVFTAGTDPPAMMLDLQRAQAAGEVGGARLLFGIGLAPPGEGPNAQLLETARVLNTEIVRGASTPEEGRAAVREVAAIPVPFVKIWVDDRGGAQTKLPRAVYEAIIDEASAHGLKVFAHQQDAEDTRLLAAAGAAGFLHGRFGPEIDAPLAALLARTGAFVVPNIGLGERAREPAHLDPFLQESLTPSVLRRLESSYVSRPGSPERERALSGAMQRLLEHDVEIVLGTDAGAVPDHFFGYTGHRELEIYSRLGMSPMEAIVAATSRAARHLGLADMGTIEAGKSADFVVLEANPAENIRNTRSIVDVYLRGERIDRDALRARFTGE